MERAVTQNSSWLGRYLRSSIGAKQVVAVTAVILVLFIVQHMTGHLVMFLGRDAYNDYAHWAQGLGHGSVKWIIRGGLLVALIAHVVLAARLSVQNRAARPVRYRRFHAQRTSVWARAMIYTGIVVFAFIVFHIAHFTVGLVQPEHFHQLDAAGRYDAYTMFVRGFEHGGILAFYVVGMTLLALHLRHGISSLFQTLGAQHPKYARVMRATGPWLTLVLYVGFLVPPLAVAAGVIRA
jgi:succinate dehydrogenase / fumarate reductase, cytochrome b subunit